MTDAEPARAMADTDTDADGGTPGRALLSDRERAILAGDAPDVEPGDNYYRQVVWRVRRRLEALPDDLAALDAHPELGDALRDVVCGDDDAPG